MQVESSADLLGKMYELTSDKGFLRHSSDDELDKISTMFDDGDGIRVKHTFCTVTIDLQQLITNLKTQQQYLSFSPFLPLPLTLSLPSLSATPPSAIRSTHSAELYSDPPLMLNPNPPPLLSISM